MAHNIERQDLDREIGGRCKKSLGMLLFLGGFLAALFLR